MCKGVLEIARAWRRWKTCCWRDSKQKESDHVDREDEFCVRGMVQEALNFSWAMKEW